jgi:hypothetical protein
MRVFRCDGTIIVLLNCAAYLNPLLSKVHDDALMLGRLEMSMDNAILSYQTLANEVFSARRRPFGDRKFKAGVLKEVIMRTVRERTGDPHRERL